MLNDARLPDFQASRLSFELPLCQTEKLPATQGKSQSFLKRAQWSCGEVIGKEMGSGMAATSCSSWKHSRNIFGPMKHKGLLLYFPRGADSASLKSTVGPVEKIEGLEEGSRQTLCIPAETHICQ